MRLTLELFMSDDPGVISDGECKFTPPGEGGPWISGVASTKPQNKTLYCEEDEASPPAP